MKKTILILLTLLVGLPAFGQLNQENFPVDEIVRRRADFWKKIYTIVDTNQGFLHDQDDLAVVYEMVDMRGMSPRQQIRALKNRKSRIRSLLLSIANKNKENLSDDEAPFLLPLLDKTPIQIREMADNIRWQRGMSDRFRQGLVDSYQYLDHIKKIFKEEGVPEEIAYLPHVESSFNYKAYSKVGAAGIWQFMRSTARVYHLKMTYVVDERLDPLTAGRAAARLLKSNFEKLGSWPLAVTAYNHGPHGMERAARTLSTTSIDEIIMKHDGGRLEFTSEDFYASFVAAYELAQNPGRYFGNVAVGQPLKFTEIQLQKALTVHQIAEAAGLDLETFKMYNRSIRPIAFTSRVPLPKDTKINLPEVDVATLDVIRSKLNGQIELTVDVGTTLNHVVSKGESLYTIAQIYKVAMNDIIVANKLANPGAIYPGFEIKIPIPPTASTTKSVREVSSTVTKPPPVLPDDVTQSYEFELKKVSSKHQSITVEVNESLAQYAEWLGNITETELAKLNRLGKSGRPKVGQKIRIPLTQEGIYEFNLKRVQYHMALEEDFYSNYSVQAVEEYRVKRGENLLKLSEEKQLPIWLIRKYLPANRKFSVRPGQVINLPKITPTERVPAQLGEDETVDE